MATFDQLAPDKRAILELVLRQGRSYEELSELLDMPTGRVRELAREALRELAPVTAERVDPDWRGQVADYVLNQQSGPESSATRGHLKRSEAARAWSLSLVDALSDLYQDGNRPEIPDTGAGARPERRPRELRRPAVRGFSSPPDAPLSSDAQAVLRRRRSVGIAAGALVLAGVVVGILAIVGVFSSGGHKKKATAAASGSPKIVAQALLRPAGPQRGAAGIALVTERGTQDALVVQAKLTPVRQRQAYEVWLFSSPSSAKSVGAQVTDQQGNFQGAQILPSNWRSYKNVVVSLERIGQQHRSPTRPILRGAIRVLPRPIPAPTTTATSPSTSPSGGTPSTTSTSPSPSGG